MKLDYMKWLFLFVVIIPLTMHSQTHRFYYSVFFKEDTTIIKNDLMVLDINAEGNIFYSNEYLHIDSLNNINKKVRFAYPKFKKIVKWNKGDTSFDFIERLSVNSYQYNTKKSISWHLHSDSKMIGSYNVQKATAEYGGRKWIAWFTNDIPFPFGPYIFYGAPGLILEVYDEKHDYHFSYTENRNFPQQVNIEKILLKYLGLKTFKIKEIDWKQIQLNYYNNPIPEYKAGEAMMVKSNGKEYDANDYRELEERIKNNIRRQNNPIELDQKIFYD